MSKNNSIKYYSINKYIICFMVSLVAGVLITLLLYNFIGFDESNRILSRDMLLAIKKYNINIRECTKERLIVRCTELLLLFVCIKTKYSCFLNKVLMTYIGFKNGLILTVFILEMQFVGVINYILITFPQDFLYIYAILRLYELFNESNDITNGKIKLKRLCKMFFNYTYITIMWGVAILAEVTLKNLFISELFIIIKK